MWDQIPSGDPYLQQFNMYIYTLLPVTCLYIYTHITTHTIHFQILQHYLSSQSEEETPKTKTHKNKISKSAAMAEEFLQGGVCGGGWWNSPRNLFSSSPCSLASNDIGGGFGWPMTTEMKSVGSSDDSASDGSSSAVLQDVHNPDHQPSRADAIALSSSTTHWNQDLL